MFPPVKSEPVGLAYITSLSEGLRVRHSIINYSFWPFEEENYVI